MVKANCSPDGLTMADLGLQTASMRVMRLSARQCQAVWLIRSREGTTTRMCPGPAKCSAIRIAVIVLPVPVAEMIVALGMRERARTAAS